MSLGRARCRRREVHAVIVVGEAVAAMTGSVTTLVGGAVSARRAERRRDREISAAKAEARIEDIDRRLR